MLRFARRKGRATLTIVSLWVCIPSLLSEDRYGVMMKEQLHVWGRPAKPARYVIDLVGLARDSVGYVTIDNKLILVQMHPTYSLALCPLLGQPQPFYSEARFYADCLSYEHDLPTFVPPPKSDFYRHSYASGLPSAQRKHVAEAYSESVSGALEYIFDMKRAERASGVFAVEFRWNGWDDPVDLPYTQKYSALSDAVHLYATALRQFDALSEYLGYYRVLENILHTNAKQWIANNLSRLRQFDFGDLTATAFIKKFGVFTVYRRRALARLRTLNRALGAQSIEHYLYNENRCGIAHGQIIKRSEFGSDYFSVVKDCYILKLLARMAIEDKVQCCDSPNCPP
jgi:hypothetical protein